MKGKPYPPPPPYRSLWLSRVRSKGNLSTEIAFLKLLRETGITGWRRHYKLPGTPDFVFLKKRLVIFIDGDFWHGNPKKYKTPKTNPEFWDLKIRTNRERDKRINRQLRAKGFRVVRVWESSLKADAGRCLQIILKSLKKLPVSR